MKFPFSYSIMLFAVALIWLMPAEAFGKKKIDLDRQTVVKMTGVSSEGYFVKAWAVAKNADKAMAQARVDVILSALRNGIEAASADGGTASLPPLLTPALFDSHRDEIAGFLSGGDFLIYVRDVSSTYPKGADNVKTPAGRKVGLSMVFDYSGLRNRLRELGWIKGLNDYFEYNGN